MISGELCALLGKPTTKENVPRRKTSRTGLFPICPQRLSGSACPVMGPWADAPSTLKSHSEDSPRPVPPTSCTLSELGPGWARFQNINLNHFLLCLLESFFSKAQFPQLLCSLHAPFLRVLRSQVLAGRTENTVRGTPLQGTETHSCGSPAPTAGKPGSC